MKVRRDVYLSPEADDTTVAPCDKPQLHRKKDFDCDVNRNNLNMNNLIKILSRSPT